MIKTTNYQKKWTENRMQYTEKLYNASEAQGKNIYNYVVERLAGFNFEPVHLKLFLTGIWRYNQTQKKEQFREYARVIVTLCENIRK